MINNAVYYKNTKKLLCVFVYNPSELICLNFETCPDSVTKIDFIFRSGKEKSISVCGNLESAMCLFSEIKK